MGSYAILSVFQRPHLHTAIPALLRGARHRLDDLNGGDRVAREGGAFGDATDDTELIADMELGKFFRERLPQLLPDVGRLTIEGLGDIEIGDGPHWATVDPLDGSLNYMHRCESLGLPYSSCITVFGAKTNARFRDVIAAGVVDLRSGDLWYAEANADGHYQTVLNRRPALARSPQTLDLGKMIVIGEMYYPENRERLARAFAGKKGWLRNPGSAAYEMALVSSGQAAAYICDRQKNHELGAAYALVTGGGGVAVDFEGNTLDFRTYDFSRQTPVILACHRRLVIEILALLERAG